MEDLFYRIEDCPKWNPALLESKIVRVSDIQIYTLYTGMNLMPVLFQKINSHTDITYQVSMGAGGGMVKSRDFVNLRCWRLFYNGKICNDDEAAQLSSDDDDNSILNRSCEGSVSTISDGESNTPLPGSVSSCRAKFPSSSVEAPPAFDTLGQSLGAKSLGPIINYDNEPPPLDQDEFEDAKDKLDAEVDMTTKPKLPSVGTTKDKVWVSSASSVQYDRFKPASKHTRYFTDVISTSFFL